MIRMEIDSDATKQFFVQAFRDETLVPIIGSGFSGGMKTPKGQVPTGTQMKNYMLDTIIEVKPEFTKEQLSTMEFSWVAQRFFEYVDS